MSSGQSNPLNPTFEGHIASTLDALMLFEACLSGQLNHVPRRPHDRERQELIKSGNIFIYEEHASGIKRWTDGVSWSPSRILGNFLIYRELEKPFPPGEKKRALKKKKCSSGGIVKPESTSSRPTMNTYPLANLDTSAGKDAERALIGSLIDSYPFKDNGLIKKTISITHQGVPHHMVSYYSVSDVLSGRLSSPSRHPSTQGIIPRTELIMSQNFRAPIDEVEYTPEERTTPSTVFNTLATNANDFGSGSGAVVHRGMTLPSFPPLQVSSGFGNSTYGYNPPQHFTPPITSSMPPPMSQPLSSPMPSLSHMGQPTPSLQTSVSMPMPSNPSHLSFATHQQGNYSLDPQKATRFGSDASLVHEFPRNMPTHNSSRRNSTFEVAQPSDLSPPPLASVTDGRQSANGTAFMRQASFYLPHATMTTPEGSVFPHRPTKPDAELPPLENGPQHYGLDENNSAWDFGPIDSSQGHQFFGNQAGGSAPAWHGGPNGVGRS